MLNRDDFEMVRMYAYKSASESKRMPRVLRKMCARTDVHRAWLQGSTGSFLISVLERVSPSQQ